MSIPMCPHKATLPKQRGGGGASTPSLSATYNVALRTLPRWLNYSSHLVSRQPNNSTWWQCRIRRQKHMRLSNLFLFFFSSTEEAEHEGWNEKSSRSQEQVQSPQLNPSTPTSVFLTPGRLWQGFNYTTALHVVSPFSWKMVFKKNVTGMLKMQWMGSSSNHFPSTALPFQFTVGS